MQNHVIDKYYKKNDAAATRTDQTSAVQQGSSFYPMSTMLMVMPFPGTPGAPYFDGKNVTDFLNRYEDMCNDFRVEESERLKRLPRYCEEITKDYVTGLTEYEEEDYSGLKKILLKDYKFADTSQQMQTKNFLATSFPDFSSVSFWWKIFKEQPSTDWSCSWRDAKTSAKNDQQVEWWRRKLSHFKIFDAQRSVRCEIWERDGERMNLDDNGGEGSSATQQIATNIADANAPGKQAERQDT